MGYTNMSVVYRNDSIKDLIWLYKIFNGTDILWALQINKFNKNIYNEHWMIQYLINIMTKDVTIKTIKSFQKVLD